MLNEKNKPRVSKYIYLTEDLDVDSNNVLALENLRLCLTNGKKNDVAKYCMPEAYKTSLVLTGNARVIQNFLSLRTDKHALAEIQVLAHKIYEAIPPEHKFLFEDSIKLNTKGDN